MARAVGSWKFVIFQSALIVAWITANVWLLTHPFDRFPFVLLNLAFSTQAAYAAPILQLSGNRQDKRLEQLTETTNKLVRQALRNDELQTQMAQNELDVLKALLDLVQAHDPDSRGQ